MNYIYTYEVRVAPLDCRCPYEWDIWAPDGTRITKYEFAFSIEDAKKEATKMAERHLEGKAGQVVEQGFIDLTPKPEPEPKRRWWKRG